MASQGRKLHPLFQKAKKRRCGGGGSLLFRLRFLAGEGDLCGIDAAWIRVPRGGRLIPWAVVDTGTAGASRVSVMCGLLWALVCAPNKNARAEAGVGRFPSTFYCNKSGGVNP